MSDNTNNGFPVPEEPLTREEQYLSAIAGVTSSSDIPEEPLTRIEAYLNKIVENGSGGSGFEPTDDQLAAMNSGITAEDVQQISTNESNISNIQTSLATYHKASGTDIYFSETEPTGNIKDGSYWISTSGVKIYGGNIFAASVEQGSFDVNNGGEITSPNRVRTQFENTSVPTGTYTISADGVDDVVVYAYTNANTSDYSAEDSVVSWQAMPYTFTTTSNLYLRFAFRKSNNANITPSVVSNVSLAKYWH